MSWWLRGETLLSTGPGVFRGACRSFSQTSAAGFDVAWLCLVPGSPLVIRPPRSCLNHPRDAQTTPEMHNPPQSAVGVGQAGGGEAGPASPLYFCEVAGGGEVLLWGWRRVLWKGRRCLLGLINVDVDKGRAEGGAESFWEAQNVPVGRGS